jgi:nucleotide-binding universal stress UspA family protein
MLTLNTRKILVPIDFSETSMLAIRHACFLAKLTRGEVLLVHVISRNHEAYSVVQPELHLDLDLKEVGTTIENRLEAMAAELRKEFGVPIATEVSSGNVSMEIVKISKEENCGLVVMGTQGYSALEMIFIGSNTMKVLGGSKIPVMSVRTEANKNGYKNIVLPIDSSQHSRQKVNLAIELCHDFGAHLHVLGLTDDYDSNFEMKLNVIFEQIEELAKKRNVAATHKMMINPDNKAKATLKYAEEVKSDLVIIMSDQDVEYTGIFLGPFASQIINFSKIPVLTVMPEDLNDISFSTPGTASW